MTTMTNARLRGSLSEAARTAAISLRLWRASRERYHRTLRELGSLSDRDLADIGIPRADIDRIAREESRRI